MGMDVYGDNPKCKTGEYFRRSCWGWRPLADFCTIMAPEITAACKNWQTNDGDGLPEIESIKLAEFLNQTIIDGRADSYIKIRNAHLLILENEICELCSGTGIRKDSCGVINGMATKVIDEPGHPRHGETGWCNGCAGKGGKRPYQTWYSLDVQDISDFAAFLRNCGGFKIC